MSTLETLLIGKTALLIFSYWNKRLDAKDMMLLRWRGSAYPEKQIRFEKVERPVVKKREMIVNIKGAE